MSQIQTHDVHPTVRAVHTLPTYRGRTLPSLLAAGAYHKCHQAITEGQVPVRVPTRGPLRPYRLYLYGFGVRVRLSVVERALLGRDLRLADLLDLLMLGSTYPAEQRRAPIAGLGTRWDKGSGEIYAPSLDGLDGVRSLNLDMVAGDREFHDQWLFAATDIQA